MKLKTFYFRTLIKMRKRTEKSVRLDIGPQTWSVTQPEENISISYSHDLETECERERWMECERERCSVSKRERECE